MDNKEENKCAATCSHCGKEGICLGPCSNIHCQQPCCEVCGEKKNGKIVHKNGYCKNSIFIMRRSKSE
jgi:hypothetical protein